MIPQEYKMVSKFEIAQLLRLKNADSVKHYHKKWDNGIHYTKCPGGNRSGYEYNLELIKHWILCHRDVKDPNHKRAILIYQRSLRP